MPEEVLPPPPTLVPNPPPLSSLTPPPPPTQQFAAALTANVSNPGSSVQQGVPPYEQKKKKPKQVTQTVGLTSSTETPSVEPVKENPILKAWALPWVKVLAGILAIIVIFFIYRLFTKEGLIIIPQIHAGSRPRPVVFDAQLI